ncbi:MAG: glycerol-3-phosphate 1-O-acyltransferase PlsB [Succinivibrionaceae bacterium]|nr:glycerol-3-phosphate 1-O-acyltransferase PlsB [Succinivibrionaceae bacterium]
MFTWLLKYVFYLPVRLLVRSRSIPADPIYDLKIDPGKPVVYILKTNSISDLLALHFHSRALSLPSPFKPLALNGRSVPRYLFLYKTPWFSNRGAVKRPNCYRVFRMWLSVQFEHPNLAIQLIAVPSVWNRSPGVKGDSGDRVVKGQLKITSAWNRMKNIITRGRYHTLFISQPVLLADLCTRVDFSDEERAARVLEKLARLHFYRTVNSSHGPKLPQRADLVREMLASASLRKLIAEAEDPEACRQEVRKIIDEIAADISYDLLTRVNGFMKIIWDRLYRGITQAGDEVVRQMANSGHEIVYIPCHRSHMDYLLLQYVIFNSGLMPPHVASGINLNFFPFGPFIRRCGAFFLRRRFKGDRVYTAVFREYVAYLCSHGYSIEFFIEGTRSRSGRMLHPRTGMLSMLVQTQLRDLSRPVTIVPVYLSYEHVMEVGSYTKEMRGVKKQAENVWQILSIFKKLRNYGRGYVGFGEPVSIPKFLDAAAPDWRSSLDPTGSARPAWLYGAVSDMARRIMLNMNDSAALNGVNLCALVLLSCKGYTVETSRLCSVIGLITDTLKLSPANKYAQVPYDTPEELLRQALSLRKFSVVEERGEETISLLHRQYLQLTYYRNNILHLFVLQSFILKIIKLSSRLAYDELLRYVETVFDLLDSEIYLPVRRENLEPYVKRVLRAFVRLQLISNINNCYEIKRDMAEEIKIMSAIANETLLRYGVFFTIVNANSIIAYDDLEEMWKKSLSRICFDSHMILAPEFSNPETLKWLIACMEEKGLARQMELDGPISFDIQAMTPISELVIAICTADIRTKIPTQYFDMDVELE